jgi:alkanesulfonate monooxygenase SsuD/methylene tetrahydromethanopterin reductase-like flavin-dependent oxidoreductase (luciferase family)
VLWADTGPDGASFSGEFFSFAAAHSQPKPLRPGGVPIHVGGTSRASMRRAATRGQGWQPLGIAGDELRHAISEMRAQVEAAGRDPARFEITISTVGPKLAAEGVEEAATAGVDRLIAGMAATDLGEAVDELSSLASRVGLST